MRVIPNPTRWEKEANRFLVSDAQLRRTKLFGNGKRVPSRSIRNVNMPPLLGENFDIYTDHACLRWLLEITDPSGRLMRWRMRLAEFDFEILQADAISHLSTQGHTTEHEEAEMPCLSLGDTYPETQKGEEVTKEPAFEDEAVKSLDIIVANLPDAGEVPSQITIEELVEAQTYDNFFNKIISALNRGDAVKFRDNPDTGRRTRRGNPQEDTNSHRLLIGPFRVTTVKERTVVIERPDKTREEVSIDRVEPALPPKDDHNALIPQLLYTNKRNPLEGGEEDPTEAPTLYIVDKIVKHSQNPDSPEGHFLYNVK
eukprot:IDg4259t1